MKKRKLWYTIEKNNNNKIWTVWWNREKIDGERGGFGSLGIYSASSKQECEDYCRKAGIKVEKGKNKPITISDKHN